MRNYAPVLHQHISLSVDALLQSGEAILIVDDDGAIREPLRIFLEHNKLLVREAGTAAEMHRILASHPVALVLLDIGLPDANGLELIPGLVASYPDLAVVMLTGVADLHVAMESIRNGAADYLAKPAQFQEIFLVVRRVLERRRLIFENFRYQSDLEQAHFRIQIFHQLTLKMNTAYLSTIELDEILQAILVGITAEEGLRFNRAFLALVSDDGTLLKGRMAIGSDCREQAGRIWSEMRARKIEFMDIVQNIKQSCQVNDSRVNELIRKLEVSLHDENHFLVRSLLERRSILVTNGVADVPVSREIVDLLGEDNFVVVPLFSPSKSLGVIIADHFVTRQPITGELVSALELFASQASLAVEHSHLYMNMEKKISELQILTHELDAKKDLLVAAERYSALGQMSAQLVHAIRNPITSIGGVARLLAKRITDEEWRKYIDMMVREAGRVEATLEELFNFVQHTEIHKEPIPVNRLVGKIVLLLQPAMEKQHISWEVNLPDEEMVLDLDDRQMQQALLHLLKNSVDAMEHGGHLVVSVAREGSEMLIRIADSGLGIANSNLARAKDPFFTTKTYGTGLGLTLVERIVHDHGGTFSMKSSEGEGTEVVVRLPVF